MGSTFGGIEIGKRGLNVHQAAIQTTGHNISNADNENYARQRVTMESMDPLYDPALNRAAGPGQLGQGVQLSQIERIRDTFYDDQIALTSNEKEFWESARNYLYQMEKIFNEPSDNTLRSLTDNFWASWQDLSSYPSDLAHREVVLERANGLVTRIHDIHSKLTDLRERADREVVQTVELINGLSSEIRELNEKILKLQALGDNPNDLMDRRDAAVERLSALVNVRVGRGDKDEVFVFIGEQALVQGVIQRKLKANPNPANDGMARVAFEHNDRDVILGGGKLLGLIEMRDNAIVERINRTNEFALNLADIVNEIHRDGFGLNGSTNRDFFHVRALTEDAGGAYTVQNARGDFDLNGDGTADMTAIFRVTGTNTVDPTRRVGVDGTITLHRPDAQHTPVRIDYSRDETLEQIIRKINDAKAGVVAYMTHDNQLALKAVVNESDRRLNFMINHIEDSGELLVGYTGLLVASGENGAFDYRRTGEMVKLRSPLSDVTLTPVFHPAAHLSIDEGLVRDPASIAAARGKDEGGTGDYNLANGMADGSNALLIAKALKQGQNRFGYAENAEAFYNALISKLGTESRTAEDAVQRQTENLASLKTLRQSVMGVNLDEEMANMVQFQHAYNASARTINTMDQMLDVIINRLKS